MTYLLDTNVVSELSKPEPSAAVLRWLNAADESELFLSVVTLAELRHGVERLPTGARKRQLEHWLGIELADRFRDRWILVDGLIAEECGKLSARCEAVGRPIAPMDAFIAATAQVHRLELVTRNVSDFQSALRSVVNPWEFRA
jgi:hypothetical protein